MNFPIRQSLLWLLAVFCGLSSADLVLAAGKSATTTKIIKTLQEGSPHSAFFGVSFDGGKGVAVGVGGAIYESADAGETWKRVAQEKKGLALLAVDKRGPHTVAVGQAGLVKIEESPGKWLGVDLGAASRLFSVSVNSGGLAVAVGEFGAVYKSANGGRSWASAAPDWSALAVADSAGTNEPNLYSAYVSEAGVITIAGEYGVILRSTDAAATWTVLRPMAAKAPTLFALHIPADSQGNSFAVGQRGELLISGDDGQSWSRCSMATQANFLGVAAASDGHVVITGMRVMMRSSNNGMSWDLVKEGDVQTDWYQGVRVESGSDRIVAVGHAGTIIQIGG